MNKMFDGGENMDFLDVLVEDKRFQIKDDMKIARYMSESKFVKNLDSQSIWFSNTKQFDDNHERTLDPYKLEGWNGKIVQKISEKTASESSAFVSCWTNFEKGENAALWKIFDKDSNGVCIISTVGQLREQLEKELPFKTVIGKVGYGREGYAPMLNVAEVASNHLGIEFLKIRPYFFEEEVRAVIYSKKDKKGYAINFDWKKITNKIIISPFTTDTQAHKLKEMINKHFNDDVLLKSKLNESEKD